MRRPIFSILGIIFIIVLAVLFFNRGSNEPSPAKKTQKILHDYANSNAIVGFTTQGKIVGDDKYRSIRITIGRDFRKVEVLDGYEQVVEKAQNFSNNEDAYGVFLRALELHGFTKSRKTPTADERGTCPTGNRYVYEHKDGDDSLQRTWSTSCNTSQGSFAGQQVVRQLFQAQITDYGKFTAGIPIQ
ncbi:hypothetical protein HY003_04295 [Candidatus Saccharibacteria bacterium]|nr:hypothetical protein [Candidatus Saccharibacteria bacterium]MBI3338489.1 hypothetical protein [Candidatus Saccharibacteria bacterium]